MSTYQKVFKYWKNQVENDIEKIINLYNSKISANKISQMLDINISTIMYNLRKNNIPIRSISENVNQFLEENNHVNLLVSSEEIDSILKGNLLGDGCLRRGKIRINYCHTDKHRDYLLWLNEKFNQLGIESTVYKNQSKNGCYALQTHSYDFFEHYYEMFYNKTRIVPEKIILNPIILRQWYISDGSKIKSGGLNISKSPFNNELMSQIKILFGDRCTYHLDEKRGWGKFYIPKKYVSDFLSYIGTCPVSCYEYKWRI